MDFDELLEKYQALLSEYNSLMDENRALKSQLGINALEIIANEVAEDKIELDPVDELPPIQVSVSLINSKSDSTDKIKLFMSLFKGRDDVYAKRC